MAFPETSAWSIGSVAARPDVARSNAAVLGFSRRSGQDARRSLRRSPPSSDLAQVALEKVIEEGADRGNGCKPRHLVPACGDCGFQNIGGKLEGKAGDEPAAQTQPDVALVVAVARREHRPQALE